MRRKALAHSRQRGSSGAAGLAGDAGLWAAPPRPRQAHHGVADGLIQADAQAAVHHLPLQACARKGGRQQGAQQLARGALAAAPDVGKQGGAGMRLHEHGMAAQAAPSTQQRRALAPPRSSSTRARLGWAYLAPAPPTAWPRPPPVPPSGRCRAGRGTWEPRSWAGAAASPWPCLQLEGRGGGGGEPSPQPYSARKAAACRRLPGHGTRPAALKER